MAMAKNKTTETHASVTGFLTKIKDKQKRADSSAIIDLITDRPDSSRRCGDRRLWALIVYLAPERPRGRRPAGGIFAEGKCDRLYLSSEFDEREELLKKIRQAQNQRGRIYIQA
jgi:hypothetical protein